MTITVNISINSLRKKGKLFKWKKPNCCPNCTSTLWGHGFVLFRNVFCKKYRCNHCSTVITMKPSKFWKKYQSSAASIYHQLKYRLTEHKWPLNSKRQRANHWLTKFIIFTRMLYGFGDEMTFIERLEYFNLKEIPFLNI